MPLLTTIKSKLQPHKKSIVKLQNKRITGRTLQKRREEVYLNSNGLCSMCERVVLFSDYELDHIISLANGGEDIIENTQCLCSECHSQKTKEDLKIAD